MLRIIAPILCKLVFTYPFLFSINCWGTKLNVLSPIKQSVCNQLTEYDMQLKSTLILYFSSACKEDMNLITTMQTLQQLLKSASVIYEKLKNSIKCYKFHFIQSKKSYANKHVEKKLGWCILYRTWSYPFCVLWYKVINA